MTLPRAAAVLVALGALLCALAACLARPREDRRAAPTRPALRAVLLDASGSAVRTRRGWARWANRRLREEARAAHEAGEDLLVVQFAAAARVEHGPALAEPFLARLEGRGAPFTPGLPAGQVAASRLDDALALAEAALRDPARSRGRLVAIVDRSATGPDPAPRLAGLARDGFGLAWRPLAPEDRPDLALEDLRLPRRVEAQAPAAGQVVLALSPGSPAEGASLVVRVEGPGGPLETRRALVLPLAARPDADGRRRWSERVEVPARPAGLHRIEVRVELPGDAVGENDRAGASLRVGEGLVALASAPADLTAALEPALAGAFPGLQFVWVAPEAMGLRLPEADLVATFDLGPGDLPDALPDFVRAGGGWVAALGWRSLGSWSRREERVGGANDLLPLEPARESGQERDVILLVDGSGSMEGEPFERVRQAVFELVPAALPSDRIELRFFTEVLGPAEFRSSGRTPAQRRAELAPLLESRLPQGGTDIGYSLEALVDARRGDDPPGLVLLITDGCGSTRPPDATREALGGARLDLRVLQVGAVADGTAYLSGLLLSGERIVSAGDLSDLARLLQLEVNRHRVRDEPGMVAQPAPASAVLGAALLPAMRAAAPAPEDWAPLGTYARAEAAPGVEVLWRSSIEGEPLLAVQRVGGGLVGALATHPGWAAFLARRPALLEPLWRAAGRGRAPGGPRLVDRPQGLVLEDCPVDWPLDLEAHLHLPPTRDRLGRVEPGPPLARLPLRPGPGGTTLDPRSRRSSPERGALEGLRRGTGLVARLVAGQRRLASLPLAAAGPAEWAGGGHEVRPLPPLPPEDPRPDPRAAAPHPAAAGVLVAGVALLALSGLLAALAGQGKPGSGRR